MINKQTFIHDLSDSMQLDITRALFDTGMETEDVARGMASRIGDLDDTIDVTPYLSKCAHPFPSARCYAGDCHHESGHCTECLGQWVGGHVTERGIVTDVRRLDGSLFAHAHRNHTPIDSIFNLSAGNARRIMARGLLSFLNEYN